MNITPALPHRIGKGLRIRMDVPRLSVLGFFVVALVSWIYILAGNDNGLGDFFKAETWSRAWKFIQELFGVGLRTTPAFLDSTAWAKAIRLSIETLAMSVLAIGIAGIGVLLTFLPAARNVASRELGGASSPIAWVMHYLTRLVFIFTRAVPELIWALMIVFVLAPGILSSALALAIHNYGILGKLSAEIVENLDPRPARALRTAGASRTQMLVYGIIPQALPQFLTYLLYRWEVIIRTTIVVGFVAAGGLGQEFRLRMSWFHYDHVLLLLICYLVLVVAVDLAAAGMRRLAK
jgi:phosphonate transport system permease protein